MDAVVLVTLTYVYICHVSFPHHDCVDVIHLYHLSLFTWHSFALAIYLFIGTTPFVCSDVKFSFLSSINFQFWQNGIRSGSEPWKPSLVPHAFVQFNSFVNKFRVWVILNVRNLFASVEPHLHIAGFTFGLKFYNFDHFVSSMEQQMRDSDWWLLLYHSGKFLLYR